MIELLDAGVDSLYWSAPARGGDWYAEALAVKASAEARHDEVSWCEVNGFALVMLPYGRSVYPVVARCAEFEIRLTDSAHIPTAYLQLRSTFLRSAGLREAFAESLAVVAKLVEGPVGEVHAARVDVYADVGGFALRAADRPGFHTRSEIAAYWHGASDALSSVRVGSGGVKVRIYDKRRERAKRQEPVPAAWGGFDGPVTRVEVEARAEGLRRFGIVSVRDALSSYGEVWRYGTGQLFVLREIADGPIRTWPVRQEWQFIQAAGEVCFPAEEREPLLRAAADKLRALRQIHGGLASLSAHLGLWTLADVLEALPDELREAMVGRSFAGEVRRRWLRLSRGVRRGPLR